MRDWNEEQKKIRDMALPAAKEAEAKRLASRVPNTKPSLALEQYAGVYGDSLYGDITFAANGNALDMHYGNFINATLDHWHYDTFEGMAKELAAGRMRATFTLDADAKVRSVDIAGFGTFGRRPDKADTTKKVVLAGAAMNRLTGTYASQAPAMSVEVTSVDGTLKLSVPGQPTYTLLPDSPTRFRLTGPPGMPAGFYAEFTLENGAATSLKMIQPQGSFVLTKK
jgi:hypothetical protein